jgi:putative ABC transport system ATP-binding protein
MNDAAPTTAPTTAPMVETHDVVKVYADGKVRALDRINLTVGTGEFVAVTGPSGCGKSTLLSLLAALDVPDSGTIRIGPYDLGHLADPDRFRRQEVGLVFQLHNLLPRLTVLENVEIVMMGSDRPHSERTGHAKELLSELGLAGLADRRPPQLSGGERQRVAVARALANDPSLLLADEPTGSLDSRSVETVLTLFEALRSDRGVTVLLVTHDDDVAASADRTISMLDGKVVGS